MNMSKRYATIINMDNIKDPDILVYSYGTMKLSTLKAQTLRKCQEFVKLIQNESYNQAAYLTYEHNDSMIIHVRSLKNIYEDIEKLSTIIK
jgi:hypothetical protein